MPLAIVLSACAAAMTLLAVHLDAQPPPAFFCGAELSGDSRMLRLAPRDEALARADFAAFRRRLQRAVARRDAASVIAAVHPDAIVSFGDQQGRAGFAATHLDNPEEDFWVELADVLSGGGRFETPLLFSAPYWSAYWPDGVDAASCGVVAGTRVRLRAGPRPDARTVGLVDHAVVEWLLPEVDNGFRHVALADGRTGYIAARYLRDPLGHRADFEFRDGRWWLTSYVAGD